MKKNTVIGWVLIAAIMVGFMVFQSKQMEKQRAFQMQRDSVARAGGRVGPPRRVRPRGRGSARRLASAGA